MSYSRAFRVVGTGLVSFVVSLFYFPIGLLSVVILEVRSISSKLYILVKDPCAVAYAGVPLVARNPTRTRPASKIIT